MVAARRSNEGEEAVRLVRQIGSDSIFLKTNVANEDDIRLLTEKRVKQYSRLNYEVQILFWIRLENCMA